MTALLSKTIIKLPGLQIRLRERPKHVLIGESENNYNFELNITCITGPMKSLTCPYQKHKPLDRFFSGMTHRRSLDKSV